MSKLNSHKPWLERRGRIRNPAGQWLAGQDAQFRDHRLLGELIHSLSETQLMVYAITGRMISVQLSTWIEKAYFMTSYPDSRLWCNSITSLAAGPGASPVAATVAGFLAADSKAYGSFAVFRAARALLELFQFHKMGEQVSDIVMRRSKKGRPPNIPGFLRPMQVADERLEPMQSITKSLGFEVGPCMQFANELSREISERFGNGMNAAAYYSAFLLDQNFTPNDLYLLCVRCAECGLLACYRTQMDDINQGFLPLQCDDVYYVGPAERKVPKN